MLSNLEVKNYKSLADFKLDLRKFNVLIGPNNSGKSNVLDCLAFLSDTIRLDVPETFRTRGGFDHVVFGGQTYGDIAIKISLTNGRVRNEYAVAFDNRGVFAEKLVIKKDGETETVISGREGGGEFYDDVEKKMLSYSYGMDNTALFNLRDFRRHHTIISFRRELEKWRFYSFVPFEMRGTFPVVKTFDPGHKGELAVGTAHSLLSEYLESFREIEETLRSAVSEIESLRSPLTKEGKTYIAVKEKHFEKYFDHYQVSDGTLRFLAHLFVLLSPKSEIPSLACFEEPENFVHPKLLQLLAEVLKKTKTQVIVTTHSPYFVDFVNPEDLVIIDKMEGKTVGKKVFKEEIEKFLKDFSLGELWYSGKIGGVP